VPGSKTTLAPMLYHPDLAATVAEARIADLHAAAARGRHDARQGGASRTQQSRSPATIQLDAYPRLCGLPVTIERLTISGARQADAGAVNQAPPDSHDKSTQSAAEKQWRRRGRLLGGSKRNKVDGGPTYRGGQHSNRPERRKQGSPL
jgi:hypothetical protein